MKKMSAFKKENLKVWMTNFKTNLLSENSTSSRRKLYNSLWAVLLGIILSLIVISFNGTNPFEFIGVVFQTAFGSNGSLFTTILLVYVFASLAVGIGFKAGLFNIGVAGQMMFGGLLAFFYLISSAAKDDNGILTVNGGQIFLALIISVIGGFSLAVIAGILKAFFKVHEVVSTILLNWMVFYLASWATSGSEFKNVNVPDSLQAIQVDSFFSGGGWIALSIILVIAVGIGFFYIFKKTTFGYKVKAVGFNPDASEYAGINKKNLTMLIFGISGAFAGFAGFFFYFAFSKGTYSVGVAPIAVGFDSIAISLLAYNSPIGIIASSFLYSILTNGNSALLQEIGLRPSSYQIIVGIIIYFAAISIVFSKFKLIDYFKNFLILKRNEKYQTDLIKYKEIKQKYKNEYGTKLETIKAKELENKAKWIKISSETKAKNDFLLKELNALKGKNDPQSIDKKVQIFNELNFNTKEKNIVLEAYGYYEKKDSENLYYSQIYELKNDLRKKQNEIIEEYYKNKKGLKVQKGVK